MYHSFLYIFIFRCLVATCIKRSLITRLLNERSENIHTYIWIQYLNENIVPMIEQRRTAIQSLKKKNVDTITEKVYNYRFDVYRSNALIASSGLLLHDSYHDIDPRRSEDTWVLNQQLQHGITY